MTNDFVQIGPARMHYERRGKGSSIVLIHGIPTHGYLWRDVASRLASSGHEVITIDLLGYGASDKPEDEDLGIAAQARRVVGALERLGWSGGAVVGHDIGGGVAQLMAIDNPRLVRRLVLVDSIAYDSFPEPGIARLKDPVWDQILGAPDFDLAKGLFKGFKRGMTHTERVTEELIANYERPFRGVYGRRAYLRAARALRTEELASRSAEVEKLTTPTLLLWGREDIFQPLGYAERLAAAMPNARLHVVEDAGHFLPEDEPRLVADEVEAFSTISDQRE